MHTRLNDTRIVEHHQSALGQMIRNVAEHVLRHLAMFIQQQLASVTLRQRKLSDTLVRQRIVIILDMYVFCLHNRFVVFATRGFILIYKGNYKF